MFKGLISLIKPIKKERYFIPRSYLKVDTKKKDKIADARKGKLKSSFKFKKNKQEEVIKSGFTDYSYKEALVKLEFNKTAFDIELLNLPVLNYHNLSKLEDQITQFDESIYGHLEDLKLVKENQHQEIYSKPVSLVSNNLFRIKDEFILNVEKGSFNNRKCLMGLERVGRSTLIAQTIALLHSKFNGDVLILHVNNCTDLVNGSNDYLYCKNKQKFKQPTYTKNFMMNFRTINKKVLLKMPLTKNIDVMHKNEPISLFSSKNTLYDYLFYCEHFSLEDKCFNFDFFVNELIHHSKTIPVIVSLDNFDGLLENFKTCYYHSDFTPISIMDFEFSNFLIKCASGLLNFEKGGVLLSNSHLHPKNTMLPIILKLKEYDPYLNSSRFDLDIANSLMSNNGIQHFMVENFTKKQTFIFLDFLKKIEVLKVRSYPSMSQYTCVNKISVNTSENVYDEELRQTKHLNSLYENYYTTTTGNPHKLLKSVISTYC